MEAPRRPNFSLGVFVASASVISKRGVSLPHLQAGGPLILDRELCPVGGALWVGGLIAMSGFLRGM